MQAVSLALIDISEPKCQLGECATWDAGNQRFLWTDIPATKLHIATLCKSGSVYNVSTLQLPEPLASFGVSQHDDILICAFASGLATFSMSSSKVDWIFRPALTAGMRFNDGKVDPLGRFWAGTMVTDKTAPASAALYCLNTQQASIVVPSVNVSNGLCFSPFGKGFYHADTPTRQLRWYEYRADKLTVKPAKLIYTFDQGHYPDGATVDAQGNIYVAVWDGGYIARLSPNGELLNTLRLPVSRPTSVTFGGKHLNELWVTTASVGIQHNKEPDAGKTMRFDSPWKGIESIRWQQLSQK